MPQAKANRPRPKPARRRPPVIPITIAVLVLLGVVAVVVASLLGDDDDPTATTTIEETRPVSVEGAPLAAFEAGGDPAVATVAPEVDGARFDGTPLRIGADGRPKVLVFLAHWCPHCQRELPVLADWLAENGEPADVDLYGIATATTPDRPNYPPSEWIEGEGFTAAVLADDAAGTAAQAMGLSAYPFFVALDGDNRVVARTTGELTVEQWEDLLARAAGTPSP